MSSIPSRESSALLDGRGTTASEIALEMLQSGNALSIVIVLEPYFLSRLGVAMFNW